MQDAGPADAPPVIALPDMPAQPDGDADVDVGDDPALLWNWEDDDDEEEDDDSEDEEDDEDMDDEDNEDDEDEEDDEDDEEDEEEEDDEEDDDDGEDDDDEEADGDEGAPVDVEMLVIEDRVQEILVFPDWAYE